MDKLPPLSDTFTENCESDFSRRVLDVVPLSVVVMEAPSLHLLWRNRAAAEALGNEQIPMHLSPVDMIHPEDRDAVHDALATLERSCARKFIQIECRFRHNDGTWRWFHLRLAVLERGADRVPTQFLGVGADISDIKAAHEEVEHEATHDPLTGIFNRRRLLTELESHIARNEGRMSLCICDIDHFKSINDTFGHPAGDSALQGFAQLMSGLLRHNDVLARLGGDEFCMLLPGQSAESAAKAVDRIRRELKQRRFVGWNAHFSVTASFGIAEFRPGMTVREWLTEADKALYNAKREGRDRCAGSETDTLGAINGLASFGCTEDHLPI